MAFFLSDAMRKTVASANVDRAQSRSLSHESVVFDIRPFATIDEIKLRITKAKQYRLDGTDPSNALTLKLLSTSRQQTWLVATPKRLYCILDDIENASPKVQWAEPLIDFIDKDGNVVAKIEEHENSEKTGLVNIGDDHHDWLFSKGLFFGSGDVVNRIETLLLAAHRLPA